MRWHRVLLYVLNVARVAIMHRHVPQEGSAELHRRARYAATPPPLFRTRVLLVVEGDTPPQICLIKVLKGAGVYHLAH